MDPLNCLITKNESGHYCIPVSSRDRPAALSIIAGRVWEPQTTQFIADNANGADVIHAGAYFGDALPCLSRSANQVWAFEPNPENFRAAEITIQLNRLTNVELRQSALGSKPELRKLRAFKEGESLGGWSHMVALPERFEARDLVDIRCVALDDVIPLDRHISVLHLDVEGSERAALEGAMQLIQRCRPILILEKPPMDWMNIHLPNYSAVRTVDTINVIFSYRK